MNINRAYRKMNRAKSRCGSEKKKERHATKVETKIGVTYARQKHIGSWLIVLLTIAWRGENRIAYADTLFLPLFMSLRETQNFLNV